MECLLIYDALYSLPRILGQVQESKLTAVSCGLLNSQPKLHFWSYLYSFLKGTKGLIKIQVYFNEVSFAQKLKPCFFSKLKNLWCHANIFKRKFLVHIWCHCFLLGKADKDTFQCCIYGAVTHVVLLHIWCRPFK